MILSFTGVEEDYEPIYSTGSIICKMNDQKKAWYRLQRLGFTTRSTALRIHTSASASAESERMYPPYSDLPLLAGQCPSNATGAPIEVLRQHGSVRSNGVLIHRWGPAHLADEEPNQPRQLTMLHCAIIQAFLRPFHLGTTPTDCISFSLALSASTAPASPCTTDHRR